MDNVLALINIDSQHPNIFTPEHVDRLVAFSHQVGIALQNARLVEQIQEYTQQLESRVQQRTAELENERELAGNGTDPSLEVRMEQLETDQIVADTMAALKNKMGE